MNTESTAEQPLDERRTAKDDEGGNLLCCWCTAPFAAMFNDRGLDIVKSCDLTGTSGFWEGWFSSQNGTEKIDKKLSQLPNLETQTSVRSLVFSKKLFLVGKKKLGDRY